MKGTLPRKRAEFEETWPAAADLSDYQYYFVKGDSNGRAALITSTEDIVVGILDNDPAAVDRGARLVHAGIAKVVTDGSSDTIARGDMLESDSSGKAVYSASNMAVAMALQPSSADGTIISCLLMLHPFRVYDDHLYIKADSDNKRQVRIGSEISVQTTDTHMGFSCKPSLRGTGTATCTGAEFSPRVQSSAAFANMMGLNVNPDIKADAGNCSGEYRGIQIKMEAHTTYSGTITGNVCGLKIVPSIHGNTTISAKYVPIFIQDGTQAGAGKNWDAAFMFGGDGGIATVSSNPSTIAGRITVLVGTTTRYIALYSSGTGG